MMPTHSTAVADLSSMPEPELAERIAGGDAAAFEALMRRFNSRLFRVARAILRDDADAEDALQDAYIEAYRHIGDFRGASALGTWLTRIVVNSALMRLRSQRRHRVVVPISERRGPTGESVEVDLADEKTESPPNAALRAELRGVLERRIDSLPLAYRTVFILREVQELSVQETAEALAIPAATVRSRLFRARALLRAALEQDMDTVAGSVFAFDGARCDRVVAAVLARLSAIPYSAP